MRLWSLHPKYLDVKGLLGVWRESLLAKKVIEKKLNISYRNHPQLYRFKIIKYSEMYINYYILHIYKEAKFRRYNFDIEKINLSFNFHDINKIPVTIGQVLYEKQHLMKKLLIRKSCNGIKFLDKCYTPVLHPIFTLVDGMIEFWEKII